MQDRSEYCNRSEVNTLQSLIMKLWSRFDQGFAVLHHPVSTVSSICQSRRKESTGVKWM